MIKFGRIKVTTLSVALLIPLIIGGCTSTAEPEDDSLLYEHIDTYGEIDDGTESYPWLSSRDTYSDSAKHDKTKKTSQKKRVVRK